jgi:hypothetical protein
MKFKWLFACPFVSGVIFVLLGASAVQDDPIQKVISQFNQWSSAHPQEKVYLQLDRPYYAIGDDIWFKAYVTVGSDHKLSALSGVLNVELIDDRDSIKQRIKLPVISGVTWGDLNLPDTLKEGNYRVRAYTNLMRNTGSDYFFDQAITISNSISKDVFTHTSFTYSQHDGREDINAVINYSNLSGAPYTAAPVNYSIKLAGKNILSGKGTTDGQGNLNILFTNPSPASLRSGRIITEIKPAGKKSVEKSVLIKAASTNTDVQFFPEGGSLVTGNETKIAFKAVGADGLGANIKGVVTDDAGNQVATFNSSHLGMGVFMLKPENGKNYNARITYADGSEGIADLPKATNAGYSLIIDNSDAQYVHVKILPGAIVSAASTRNEVMTLIAQASGTICFEGKSQPDSKSFTADIPKAKFPSGVAQFTLFSSTGEPLNERLVFIQNHDQLKLQAATDQQVYAPRQKVKIGLDAIGNDGKPAIGSFSVAVINETKVPVDEESQNSILSNLLLTSDIKGYIEKPSYYFNNENEQTRADLDILMLTQGYHRFEWKQILSGINPTPTFLPEKTLEISGHLKNLLGKPVPNGKVTLFSTAGGIFMVDTLSDSKGHFTFKNLIFKDSVRFAIQARTAKDHKNVEVDIDEVEPEPTVSSKMMADFLVNYDSASLPFLQSSKAKYDNDIKYGLNNHSILLKEVVIKDKKTEPIKNSSNLNGPGNADQVISADDNILAGCGDITDCLQGRLTGVMFRNDTPYLTQSRRPMQIVLDGLYVDGSVLTSLNPSDVGSVEVLRNIQYTSIYGGRGSSGVLIITSKTGSAGSNYQRYTPGIVSYIPKGYTKVREFYSPKYDDPKTNAAIPDLRSTIYWKPNLITDKEGKASFEYFNADEKGTYRMVIEGIDSNGNLGRLVYRYKVE